MNNDRWFEIGFGIIILMIGVAILAASVIGVYALARWAL